MYQNIFLTYVSNFYFEYKDKNFKVRRLTSPNVPFVCHRPGFVVTKYILRMYLNIPYMSTIIYSNIYFNPFSSADVLVASFDMWRQSRCVIVYPQRVF